MRVFLTTIEYSRLPTPVKMQVPLPEKIISDTPAFNIRPGKPTAVDEAVWDESSSPSIIQELLSRRSAGKYSSWPKETPASAPAEHLDPELSLIIPTVSKGAKAIIRAAPIARQALPCVHEGFLKNYLRVRQEIIAAILSIFKRQLDKSVDRSRHGEHDEQPLTLPKLYLTGHSMGGAFAQLLALDLASNCEIVIDQPIQQTSDQCYDNGTGSKQSLTSLGNRSDESGELSDLGDAYWLGQELAHHHHRMPTKKIRLRPPIAVYTYGQSRLGNLAFKTIYKKRVPHTFRVATEGDAITTMPTLGPWCGGIYRHAGEYPLCYINILHVMWISNPRVLCRSRGPVGRRLYRERPRRTNCGRNTITLYQSSYKYGCSLYGSIS